MTVGSPPSMTATTLFVVPRSIPMILAMWWVLLGWARGLGGSCRVDGSLRAAGGIGVGLGGGRDRDERRPQDAIAELVPATDHVDDLALGTTGARDVDD